MSPRKPAVPGRRLVGRRRVGMALPPIGEGLVMEERVHDPVEAQAQAEKVQSPNYTGALFSFLRALAVALSSAALPFLVVEDEIPLRALLIALGSAALLTVINFFRKGETRFGTPPNEGAPPE